MFKRSENLKTPFLLFSIIFFLAFIPLVSSIPPFQTNINPNIGYQIFYPEFEFVPLNSPIDLHVHLTNISNGLPLNNNQADCFVNLYDNFGSDTFESGSINKDVNGYDYVLFVSQGNHSTLGLHTIDIRCNSSYFGGQAKFSYYVTQNGESLSTATGIIYFLITLFAFGVFFLITWIFLNINGENPKDETGYIGLNYRKYIKTALFPLVYVSFLWFFNFIIGLSNNYLGLTLYSNTLGFIFILLTKLTLPVLIVTLLIELVLMIKDGNIEKEYKSLWNKY